MSGNEGAIQKPAAVKYSYFWVSGRPIRRFSARPEAARIGSSMGMRIVLEADPIGCYG